MKALVIGASGQLAQCLLEAPVRSTSAAAWSVTAAGRPELDITSLEAVRAAIAAGQPDIVVNAAAYTAVDKAETEADAAFRINADGAGFAATAAHECGLPIIHISTDYVYDGAKQSPYVETDPTSPVSVYGSSKLAGERAVATANPRHVILRTAWVHSPFGANFVKTMLRLAAMRPEISVVDDQRGNPTYAPHLAEAILAIAGSIVGRGDGERRFGIYHAAGRGDVTWCGLARQVMDCAARHGLPAVPIRPITTADYPTPARRPANSRLDTHRLEQSFGIALPSWQDGVDQCVARLAGAPSP